MSAPPWHADIEVTELDDGWIMTAHLPGFRPDEVALDVTDRELVIRANRVGHEPTDDFAYRLAIPPDADPDAVEATMDGDLLEVRLPRLLERRSRRIEVRHRQPAPDPDPPVESADGSAADESLLGPSPGSVVAP